MKKICDKCGVVIEDSRSHCPLCGRCCDKSATNDINECYPQPNLSQSKVRFWTKLIIACLCVGAIMCLLVDWLFIKNFWLTLHFSLVSFVFIISIILPIRFNFTLARALSVINITFPLYLITLEHITNSVGWALNYASPMLLLASTALCLFVFLFKKKDRWSYMYSLIVNCITSLCLFLADLFTSKVVWGTFVALVSSITLLFFLFIFRYKKSKNEISKNFHI